MTAEYWYRYEDVVYAAPVNEWGESEGRGRLSVELRKYAVVRHTPCGVRLDIGRFVNRSSRKMFAHPTLEAAKESFIARKERQAAIHEARATRALDAIEIMEAKNDHSILRSHG